jgi:feruloyl esterase
MTYKFLLRRAPRLTLQFAFSILGLQALAAHASDSEPRDCEALTSRKILENTTITSAKMQPADAERHRPPFCEVIATAAPVPGSNITIVVRMPDTWNGKLLGSGGGGWAGNTNLIAPAPGLPPGATPGLVAGYTVAQTNGGHEVAGGARRRTGRSARTALQRSQFQSAQLRYQQGLSQRAHQRLRRRL